MTDLQELFSKDPLEHTKDDIAALVEELRKRRAQFNLGNTSAGSTKPKTEKQKQAAALADKLDLKGIEL